MFILRYYSHLTLLQGCMWVFVWMFRLIWWFTASLKDDCWSYTAVNLSLFTFKNQHQSAGELHLSLPLPLTHSYKHDTSSYEDIPVWLSVSLSHQDKTVFKHERDTQTCVWIVKMRASSLIICRSTNSQTEKLCSAESDAYLVRVTAERGFWSEIHR